MKKKQYCFIFNSSNDNRASSKYEEFRYTV